MISYKKNDRMQNHRLIFLGFMPGSLLRSHLWWSAAVLDSHLVESLRTRGTSSSMLLFLSDGSGDFLGALKWLHSWTPVVDRSASSALKVLPGPSSKLIVFSREASAESLADRRCPRRRVLGCEFRLNPSMLMHGDEELFLCFSIWEFSIMQSTCKANQN